MLKTYLFIYNNSVNIIDSRINLDFVTKENGNSRLEYKVYDN